MVVMDPVDPRLDCGARRSSHWRSQSHETERGSVVGSVVVVAIGEEVIVGCSCRVGMSDPKGFYHQKRFHGSLFLAQLPPSKFHGRSFSPTATSSSTPAKRFLGTRFYRPRGAINTPGAPTSRWRRMDFLQMRTRGNSVVE